ncbi:MAG: chalcone isomerase family protein [Polyangiaceae bacterium]
MKLTKITSVPFLLLLLAMLTTVASAWALQPGSDGWYHTGDGTRVKTMFKVNVYDIGHDMKCLPPAKSKQAVIDADCDKKFTWVMRRDVSAEKIRDALSEAYAMNGYKDAAKTAPFLAALNRELKENTKVIITYNAANKTTSIAVGGGGGNATVPGIEFMKATWSIWFGKIDQPTLGDALIRLL